MVIEKEANRIVKIYSKIISDINPLNDYSSAIKKCSLNHVNGILVELSKVSGIYVGTTAAFWMEVMRELNKMEF